MPSVSHVPRRSSVNVSRGADDQYLIRRRRIRMTACRDEDAVRMRAIRNGRRELLDAERAVDEIDCASARAHVAADRLFRGCRGEQQLLPGYACEQIVLPCHVGRMIDDARDLALVHRIDHRSRCTALRQRLAKTRHGVELEAIAAECTRDHRGQQAFVAHRVERFVREASFAIHRARMRSRNHGYATGGGEQRDFVTRWRLLHGCVRAGV